MNFKIRTKFFLIFIALVIIIGAIGAFTVGFYLNNLLKTELLDRITLTSRSAVSGLSDIVLANDKNAAINFIFNEKSSRKDISYIMLLDENNNLIASTLINQHSEFLIPKNKVLKGQDEAIKSIVDENGSDIYDIAMRLKYEKGVLRIGYYIDQINSIIFKVMVLLGISAVVSIVFAFIFVFFFSKIIFRPLDTLKNTVSKVAAGDLTQRAFIKSNDEIGYLAGIFNQMLDNINQLQKAQFSKEEEKYRNLIENTPLCIKVFDENRNMIFLNKGGREEHFIKDTDDISKWDWLNTVKEQYQDEAKKKFSNAFIKGESSMIEFEHVPEKSTHEWCSSLISPIKDKNGKVTSVLFLSSDITALKRAELEAKKNERMFRTLIDETPLCIKWFDNKGNLISINKGGREEHFLTKKTEEEIKSWDYMSCIDGEYQFLVKKGMIEALKGITSNFEIKHVPGTSKGQWCFSTLTPVKDDKGNVAYVLFLSRDITDEKLINEERKMNLEKSEETKAALFNILEDVKESEIVLKEERDKSSAIISSIGENLLVIDKNYNIVLMNAVAEKTVGLPANKVVGQDIRKIITVFKGNGLISDEDRPLEKVLKNGIPLNVNLDDDFYYQIFNGAKFPVTFISTPLIKQGDIIGAVLVFRNITGEKALDEAKSNFISIASHQLRTPLTSMRWFSEMLIGGDAGPLGEEQKHFVERIYQATDRMIDLVNLLLQIARVEAGRIKVESVPLSLKELTQSVAASLKSNLDQKLQTVKIITDPDPFPLIPLDQDIIWQVIQNLISNASRYSDKNKQILVSIVKREGIIEYSVEDQGIGIPIDQRGRLFEKFFRAENALKMVPEGSGLGLSLVKSLVEGWGGKIWFKSEEKKGTTFIFTIPAAGMASKEGDVKLAV